MEATRPLSQGGKLRVERAETVGIIGMEREQIEQFRKAATANFFRVHACRLWRIPTISPRMHCKFEEWT